VSVRARIALTVSLTLASVVAMIVLATSYRDAVLVGYGTRVEDLSRAVVAHPDEAELRHRLAEALLERGAWVPAEQTYDRLLRAHPHDAVARMRRGAIRFVQGRNQAAIEDLTAGIAASAAPPWDAWAWLGAAHAREGDVDAAIDALEQSVTLYPSSASTRVELAHALEQRGELDAASHHLAIALSLDPLRPDAAPLRARLTTLRDAIGVPDDPVPGVDATRAPLHGAHGIWAIDVAFDAGIDGRLAIDTGASRTTLTRTLAWTLGLEHEAPLRHEHFLTAAGPVTLPIYAIDGAAIGGAHLGALEVAVCDACGGPGLDGLLGLDSLAGFRVTLDPERAHVVLERTTVTHPWQRPDRPMSAALLPHGARIDPAAWQP